MPPAEEVLRISLQADLRQLQASLAELPGISEREAKLMVAGLNRQLRLAEAAAKRAASESEKAWYKAGQGLKGILTQVGGVGGQVGQLFGEVGSKFLDAASGATGLQAGLIGIGGGGAVAMGSIALIVAGAKSLADAALAARDRLEEQGRAAEIPAEAQRSLDQYKTASSELRTSLDELTVVLGAELADDLAVLATNLSDVVDATKSASEWAGFLHDWYLRIVSLGISDVVLGQRDAMHEQALATVDATNRLEEQADMYDERYRAALADAAEEGRRQQEQVKANEQAERALNRELAEAARVRRELLDINEREIADAQAYSDKLAEQLITHIRMADAERKSAIEMAAFNEEVLKANEAIAGFTKEWSASTFSIEAWAGALGDALNSQVVGTLEQIGANIQQLNANQITFLQERAAQQVAGAQAEAEAWAAFQTQQVEALLEQGSISEAEAERRLEAIDAELTAGLDAAEELADDEQEQAERAFKANQNLQRVQAIVDAARAAMALIPSFAYLGPGAPAAAAALAGAALATQLAIIDSQRPPQFPTGMDPDHFGVGVQRGEGIASRRAMRDPELREALEEGNRGVRRRASRARDGGGGGAVRVLVGLDRRAGKLRVTSERIGKKTRRR